jgi:hypothetical protein
MNAGLAPVALQPDASKFEGSTLLAVMKNPTDTDTPAVVVAVSSPESAVASKLFTTGSATATLTIATVNTTVINATAGKDHFFLFI